MIYPCATPLRPHAIASQVPNGSKTLPAPKDCPRSALLAAGVTVSVQVLNETANVLRRKAGLSWSETRAFLATVRSLVRIEPVTITTHEEGMRIAERYQLALYDGTIVAAARLAGCDLLWSEDMQDGLLIDDTLRIANPFAAGVP